MMAVGAGLFRAAEEGEGRTMGTVGVQEMVVIFLVALVLFGPKKLPELGKGIGEGIRGFKSAMKAEEEKTAITTTTVPDGQNVTKG